MNVPTDEILEQWSDLAVETRFRRNRRHVPEPVLATGSVLVPGADEAAIARTEGRLGLSLPPSYRAFLRRTNGAYAGPLGLEDTGWCGWRDPPSRPTSLLPVEAIGPSATNDPFSVDLSTELLASLPYGQTTLTQPWRSEDGEIAFLDVPATGAPADEAVAGLYWSVLIGWVWDPSTLVVLNPMIADANGEWELDIVHPDGAWRYPSFGAWLTHHLDQMRSNRPDTARARSVLLDPDTAIRPPLGAVRDLLGVADDLDWLASQAELGLDHEQSTPIQHWALTLLVWIDSLDGGHRFAGWLHRILADTRYEMSVVELAEDSTDPDVPSGADILAHERPADLARLPYLPTEVLAERYQASPDPIIADALVTRGHPLVCSPAAVELHQRLLAPAQTAGGIHLPFLHRLAGEDVGTVATNLTAEDIVAAAAETRLSPELTARALAMAGHHAAATEHLRSQPGLGFQARLFALAEIDTPEGRRALDAEVDAMYFAGGYAFLAVARTHSPSLARVATAQLDGDERVGAQAILALEIQPTDTAADALLDRWRQRSDLRALRALGRRRDSRVVDDAALLLADPDIAMRQVGAEVLRDLRSPETIAAVTTALEAAEQDDLIVVLAHTLAMMQVVEAGSLLAAKADTTNNETLAKLLRRWADQLASAS